MLALAAHDEWSEGSVILHRFKKMCIRDSVKAECVVTDEGNGILEIKNIAVDVVMLLCMYQ